MLDKSLNGHFELVKRHKTYKSAGDPRHHFFLKHIRYSDPKSEFAVRIFVNHLAPAYGAELIERYCAFDPRVKPMVEFVLYWAKCRGILGPEGGYLSSYALTLMVIFFLGIQRDPVLYSIQLYCKEKMAVGMQFEIPSFGECLSPSPAYNMDGQIMDPQKMAKFDHSFGKLDVLSMRRDRPPHNEEKVGALLAKFFYYFGVDYPRMVEKSMTRKMSVINMKYVATGCAEEKEMPFCIEDPIDPTYNPGYTVVFGKEYKTILYEFSRAYLSLFERTPELLEVPYEV